MAHICSKVDLLAPKLRQGDDLQIMMEGKPRASRPQPANETAPGQPLWNVARLQRALRACYIVWAPALDALWRRALTALILCAASCLWIDSRNSLRVLSAPSVSLVRVSISSH